MKLIKQPQFIIQSNNFMARIKQSDSGFTAIEVLLILLALAIIGIAGWFVAKDAASTHPSKTTSEIQTTNPYAGWAHAELKYEKLSFEYPATWKLDNQSSATTESGQYGNGVQATCAYPGMDFATITAPNGLSVELQADGNGTDCSNYQPLLQLSSTPLTTLGGKYYVSFVNQNHCDGSCRSDEATNACLSTSAKNFTPPVTKNIKTDPNWNTTPVNVFCIQASGNNGGPSPYKAESVGSLKANPSFNDAILILKSLHY